MYNYREFMNNVQSTLIKPGNGACRLSSFTDSVIQEVIRWVYTPYYGYLDGCVNSAGDLRSEH
jgi:hypothetical protein